MLARIARRKAFRRTTGKSFVEAANLLTNKSGGEFRERDCFQAVAIDDGWFREHIEVFRREFNNRGETIGATAFHFLDFGSDD